MNVTFSGYYGQLNTGDDSFCVVSDWGAKKFWHAKDVKFIGGKLPYSINGEVLSNTVFNKKYFRGQHYIESLVQPVFSRNLIYAGGSIFHKEIKVFSRESIFQNYNDLGFLSLAAIGVSVGPFNSKKAKESLKNYLSKFSFISLRDERSYNEVIDMDLDIPVAHAFDLAALLPMIYNAEIGTKRDLVLGISPCYYERYIGGDENKDYVRLHKMINTLELLIKRIPNLKLKIFVFNAHETYGDNEIADVIADHFDNKVEVEKVGYERNTEKMWRHVSQCNAMISTRLHAGIFACFAGVPFIQIEYHKKCTDFLNEVGYESDYLIGDFESGVNHVASLLEGLLLGDRIPSVTKINDCKNRALLNFTEFTEYL